MQDIKNGKIDQAWQDKIDKFRRRIVGPRARKQDKYFKGVGGFSGKDETSDHEILRRMISPEENSPWSADDRKTWLRFRFPFVSFIAGGAPVVVKLSEEKGATRFTVTDCQISKKLAQSYLWCIGLGEDRATREATRKRILRQYPEPEGDEDYKTVAEEDQPAWIDVPAWKAPRQYRGDNNNYSAWRRVPARFRCDYFRGIRDVRPVLRVGEYTGELTYSLSWSSPKEFGLWSGTVGEGYYVLDPSLYYPRDLSTARERMSIFLMGASKDRESHVATHFAASELFDRNLLELLGQFVGLDIDKAGAKERKGAAAAAQLLDTDEDADLVAAIVASASAASAGAGRGAGRAGSPVSRMDLRDDF